MTKKSIRPIRIEGDVAYVPLTRGYEAVIDAGDVALVDGMHWQAKPGRRDTHTVYAASGIASNKMHRIVMSAPDGMEVDHIDGNGLNNRKSNLRLSTREQNRWNVSKRPDNTSGHKGVTFEKETGKWLACIRAFGVQKKLGRFKCPTSAAIAYAKASREMHGEFGRVA